MIGFYVLTQPKQITKISTGKDLSSIKADRTSLLYAFIVKI